jgi:ABC-type nitrate/sulfonate/bicarbonate transport system permease component
VSGLARGAGVVRRLAPAAAVLAALAVLWEVWVRLAAIPDYTLPPPSQVATALWRTRAALWGHSLTTASETLLGIALGSALGVAVAVAMAMAPLLRRALEPLLIVTQTIPLFVLAPLLVLWFGFGMTAKVVVVVLIVFFPVAVSTAGALAAADADQIDLIRSLGGDRTAVMRLVRLPAAVPAFFDGLRISAAYAAGGATLGELIGAQSGLGLYIARSQRGSRPDQMIAGVGVVAALSLALFGAVLAAAAIAAPWRRVTHHQGESA